MKKFASNYKPACYRRSVCYIFLIAAAILLAASSGVLLSKAGPAKNERKIYLAGAPNQWPIEYYDRKAGTYKGVLPDLLKKAGDSAGITFHYIDPSAKDQRLSLAENVQVDAISTVGFSREELAASGLQEGAELLSYAAEGKEYKEGLFYTKSMEDSVRAELEDAASRISESEIQGMYLAAAANGGRYNDRTRMYTAVMLGTLLMLAAALFVAFWKFRKKRRQIEKLAYEDDITGHGNFGFWKKKYQQIITERNRDHYAVIYLNAGIEQIAHIYGYAEADEALKLTSDVCGSFLDYEREEFTRFNEFSFAFFMQYTNIELLKERMQEMENAVVESFKEKKKKYFLDLHAGIYCLSGVSSDPMKALQFSEISAEYAVNNFQDVAVYDEYVEQKTVMGYAMEHEAIHGLVHQEFLIYLQPIVRLKTKEICAAEALVRWQNPNRGLLKPEAFLNVMKKKNLTGKMNIEIYRQGIHLLKEAKDRGRKIQMLFNFTVENTGDKRFADELKGIADQNGISPSSVIIQMNQIVEMSKSGLYAETIRKLRAYGFDVCIAGLELDRVFFSYLEAGINEIKLRHELISQSGDKQGEIILRGITAICQKLGLKMIGVGVENKKQAKLLRKLGCETASGYYFYYPLSKEEFMKLLSGGGISKSKSR